MVLIGFMFYYTNKTCLKRAEICGCDKWKKEMYRLAYDTSLLRIVD